MKPPAWALESDVNAIGTFGDLGRFDVRLVEQLFVRVDRLLLAELRQRKPDAAFELLLGGDVLSLWYADRRISVISAPWAYPPERSPRHA